MVFSFLTMNPVTFLCISLFLMPPGVAVWKRGIELCVTLARGVEEDKCFASWKLSLFQENQNFLLLLWGHGRQLLIQKLSRILRVRLSGLIRSKALALCIQTMEDAIYFFM